MVGLVGLVELVGLVVFVFLTFLSQTGFSVSLTTSRKGHLESILTSALRSEILFFERSKYFTLGKTLNSLISFSPIFLRIKHSRRVKLEI